MTDPTQSPPQPVNTTDQTAQDALNVVNTLIGDGITTAESAIIAADPVMATPVWKQIWEKLLETFVGWFIKPFIDTFTDKVLVNSQEYFAMKTAIAAQVALDQAKKTGDPHAIEQASQAVDTAVAPVIQFIGATHS